MKLGRSGSSLFPRRLTKVWLGFAEDYVKVHEEAHAQIIENMGCPWNTSPKTVDEFIKTCDARSAWEKENNAVAPTWWGCIITHSLFEELAREVKELRDGKRNS